MAYPVSLPTSPLGYDIGIQPRGNYGGFYNGAHYAFLSQSNGDQKLHALKSIDDGLTWVEQDSTHAPDCPVGGLGVVYTMAAPDGNIVRGIILQTASAAFPQNANVTGIKTISYDLSTDTWGALSSNIVIATMLIAGTPLSPTPGFYLGYDPYYQISLVLRGPNDYVFTYGGTESVSHTPYPLTDYPRTYVCSWDGASTFGTSFILPGQAGNAQGYYASRAAVDSNGITHFWYQTWGSDFGDSPIAVTPVFHIGMAAGAVGTFGSLSQVTLIHTGPTTNGTGLLPYGFDPGYLGEPIIGVFGGIEKLFVPVLTYDSGTLRYFFSIFSATAALNPSWPADPGDTAIVGLASNFLAGEALNYGIFLAFVYTGTTFYAIISTTTQIGSPTQTQSQIEIVTSMDLVSWVGPAVLWTAPSTIGSGGFNQWVRGVPGVYAYQVGTTQNVGVMGSFSAFGAELTQFFLVAPVTPPTLSIACPVDGGTAQIGVLYDKTLQISGGTQPYTVTIIP